MYKSPDLSSSLTCASTASSKYLRWIQPGLAATKALGSTCLRQAADSQVRSVVTSSPSPAAPTASRRWLRSASTAPIMRSMIGSWLAARHRKSTRLNSSHYCASHMPSSGRNKKGQKNLYKLRLELRARHDRNENDNENAGHAP